MTCLSLSLAHFGDELCSSDVDSFSPRAPMGFDTTDHKDWKLIMNSSLKLLVSSLPQNEPWLLQRASAASLVFFHYFFFKKEKYQWSWRNRNKPLCQRERRCLSCAPRRDGTRQTGRAQYVHIWQCCQPSLALRPNTTQRGDPIRRQAQRGHCMCECVRVSGE